MTATDTVAPEISHAAQDLTDLGEGWHTWAWGDLVALVRRLDDTRVFRASGARWRPDLPDVAAG